ncbi:Glu/Leu/Phe/Val dehydrogenase [Polyangium aurulentum]|uniref:Glu/Leu/Phe/Val dehydrogenase n=1 Tax=Polyangium aurulentum TaxID=2567896 RepID=UPI00146AA2E6|nr:Glu/Leu/Phe/Val dehydrogenase [Polyangium aurulentum]UQA56184.1 hypothetical protein E8A73_033435 [Polyangium aurulentum]
MTVRSTVDVRTVEDREAGGRFTIYRTEHEGGIVAQTALHAEGLPNSVGGVRMVVTGALRELLHLSAGMTDKLAAADLPCHGQKSLIVCPNGLPVGNEARAAILADHIREVRRVAPGVIFGPDMGISEEVLDLVARDPELRAHVAGCTEIWGGLSIDQEGYTGAGLVAAIDVARQEKPHLPLETASIQGFGAVGAHAGRLLAAQGIRVIGASIAEGALLARDPKKGLPVLALFEAWRRGGDAEVRAFARAHEGEIRWESDPDVLFETPADVFVPAARTTVLATAEELSTARAENPKVRDVLAFAEATGVRLVAEGANHPLSYAAEAALEARGVVVVPDIIGNPGGVVGCYFEWLERTRVLAAPRERARVARAARGYADEAIRRNTRAVLASTLGSRAATRVILDEAMRRWRAVADPVTTFRHAAERFYPAAAHEGLASTSQA